MFGFTIIRKKKLKELKKQLKGWHKATFLLLPTAPYYRREKLLDDPEIPLYREE